MNSLLQQFQPISLDEMKGIRLMNRTDTKFVTSKARLMQLLAMATGDYRIQETLGERNIRYETTYFDTDKLEMFRAHHSGHLNRQKIRFRTYVSSHLQFMEVKTKNNHGRTKKKRMAVTDMSLADDEKLQFLSRHLRYDAATLTPAIFNSFNRITLVNNDKTERLTIDTGLWFRRANGNQLTTDDLVIIELKRDGLCPSPILQMLRDLRIFPHGFSKYCMGMALTDPSLPKNRIKLKLIEVEKTLWRDGASLYPQK